MATTGTTFINASGFTEINEPQKQTKSHSSSNWSNYDQLREKDIIRYAKKEGYLKLLSVEDVLKHSSRLQEGNTKNLENVNIISLISWKLPSVGPLSLCSSLLVCNLSNNFIKRIDPLGQCTKLRKLDLHSNQISILPGEKFWCGLKDLTILYLHNNSISDYQYVKNISYSPKLSILTMYDTPFSLRTHYRHCVVNAIWSLKALDHIVVSDEEIIEDAKFTPRFSALQRVFHFNPQSLHEEADHSLTKELQNVAADCAEVNRLQSEHCPVLIIQKTVRGHLARQHYRFMQEQRTWAAVSIQRFYRQWKGIPDPPSTSVATLKDDDLSSLKLDYETYIRMRRSREKGLFSSGTTHAYPSDVDLSVFYHPSDKSVNKTRLSSRSAPKWNSLASLPTVSIDFDFLYSKLEDAFSKFGKTQVKKALPVNGNGAKVATPLKSGVRKKSEGSLDMYYKVPTGERWPSKRDRCKVGRYFTPCKFLGEVPDSSTDNKQTDAVYNTDDSVDHDSKIDFRLSTLKPPCLQHEPIDEIILRVAQGAEDIRHSIRVIEDYLASVPPRLPTKNPHISADQRMFLRTHGTMSLSSFYAVERAYRDRESSDKWRAKRKFVRDIRTREKKVMERTRHSKNHRANKTAIKSKKERVILESRIAEKMDAETRDLQQRVENVKLQSVKSKSMKKDGAFVSDFNTQMSSIGTAVAVHNRSGKKIEEQRRKNAFVEDMRNRSETQKETVKKYFSQRVEVRRAENALERANIDALLASQKEQKASDAKDRIRRLKEEDSHYAITSFLPHPTSVPIDSKMLAVISDMQLMDWEKHMSGYMEEERNP